MKKAIVKSLLLMAGVILAALNAEVIDWASAGITAMSVGAGYFIKNYWLPSVSSDEVFDWRDIASALLLAVFTTIGESVSSLVVDGSIDVGLLVKTILTVVSTYFAATFFPSSKAAKV